MLTEIKDTGLYEFIVHTSPEDMLAVRDEILLAGYEIADERSLNKRNINYLLDEDYVKSLLNDPRVITIVPKSIYDIENQLEYMVENVGFDATNFSSDSTNWGLGRHSRSNNPFGDSLQFDGDINWQNTGQGVDIVIMDTGIADHPEFWDSNGVSRVQQIDWYAEAGLTGSLDDMVPEGYTYYGYDSNGHGTHCASIAAGRWHGWAKDAHLYDMKTNLGTDYGFGIQDAFDLIQAWHNNKTSGRPTVVNMSWGSKSSFAFSAEQLTQNPEYNGVTHPPGTNMISNGVPINFTHWTDGIKYKLSSRSAGEYDDGNLISTTPSHLFSEITHAELQECVDSGMFIVKSAGNHRAYTSAYNDENYNDVAFAPPSIKGRYQLDSETRSTIRHNIFKQSGVGTGMISVGSLKATSTSVTNERVSEFSVRGPGVDIYAAGEGIMAASIPGSLIDDRESVTSYPYTKYGNTNENYRQFAISGTSMAAPQVVGLIATYLQTNQSATPAQVRNVIINSQQSGLDNATIDYANLNITTEAASEKEGGYLATVITKVFIPDIVDIHTATLTDYPEWTHNPRSGRGIVSFDHILTANGNQPPDDQTTTIPDPEPAPVIDEPQAPELFAHNATFSNFNMSGSFRITR